MISVWATNGISQKLQPGNALPRKENFFPQLASGRYAKRPLTDGVVGAMAGQQ